MRIFTRIAQCINSHFHRLKCSSAYTDNNFYSTHFSHAADIYLNTNLNYCCCSIQINDSTNEIKSLWIFPLIQIKKHTHTHIYIYSKWLKNQKKRMNEECITKKKTPNDEKAGISVHFHNPQCSPVDEKTFHCKSDKHDDDNNNQNSNDNERQLLAYLLIHSLGRWKMFHLMQKKTIYFTMLIFSR